MLKQPIKIIGCKAKNENVLMESQSGGAFALIAEYFLERGAIVYGCGMDENNEAVYKRIEHTADLKEIKGSKYVQAQLNNTFARVLEDINSGKTVLFSGTPCYVEAVQNFVKKSPNANLLFTADLICHGVPSPKVYREYKQYLEEKYHSKIMKFIFRYKNWGGGTSTWKK